MYEEFYRIMDDFRSPRLHTVFSATYGTNLHDFILTRMQLEDIADGVRREIIRSLDGGLTKLVWRSSKSEDNSSSGSVLLVYRSDEQEGDSSLKVNEFGSLSVKAEVDREDNTRAQISVHYHGIPVGIITRNE